MKWVNRKQTKIITGNTAPEFQEKLNEAVEKLTGEKSPVIFASRTDSGVHALGQVAIFDTDMDLDTYERLRGRSLREVKQTKGEISFEDDLIFQKSL